jgi:hypothetical protein
MSHNPYSQPAPMGLPPQGRRHPGDLCEVGDPRLFEVVAPLYDANGWLRLIGWANIVLGAIYCLTIIGAIIGWLPLWIGFLLKNAADKYRRGYQTEDGREIYLGNKDLKTVITIFGVLMLINLVFLALYVVLVIVALAVGIVGASMN